MTRLQEAQTGPQYFTKSGDIDSQVSLLRASKLSEMHSEGTQQSGTKAGTPGRAWLAAWLVPKPRVNRNRITAGYNGNRTFFDLRLLRGYGQGYGLIISIQDWYPARYPLKRVLS